MHFFLGGCDWYAIEFSPDDGIFFGYAILNCDLPNSEWGYFSLDELVKVRTKLGFEVDRDLHWNGPRVRDVQRILDAYQARGAALD